MVCGSNYLHTNLSIAHKSQWTGPPLTSGGLQLQLYHPTISLWHSIEDEFRLERNPFKLSRDSSITLSRNLIVSKSFDISGKLSKRITVEEVSVMLIDIFPAFWITSFRLDWMRVIWLFNSWYCAKVSFSKCPYLYNSETQKTLMSRKHQYVLNFS